MVNIGKQSMTIVQLVAAANEDDTNATLFACKKGACKGLETTASSWRQVWKGTLKDHKPTTLVMQESITIESGEKQGFLLHTEKHRVLYSKQVLCSLLSPPSHLPALCHVFQHDYSRCIKNLLLLLIHFFKINPTPTETEI